MTRDLQNIQTIKNLNADSWAKIFSHHLGRHVRLTNPAQATEFKTLDGHNDFFGSEIVKIRLDFVDEKEESKDNQLLTFYVVVKNPINAPFVKKMSRFLRPFMSEIFFYTRASPTFPEISDLFPICYFGSSTYDEQLFHRPVCERHCCFLCWCCCRKEEVGVLVMEDITVNPSEGSGYKLLDKVKVPSVDHIRLAMKSLARCHGTWLVFLNKWKDRSDVPFTPEEIRVAFNKDRGIMLKPFVNVYRDMFKAVVKLMKNRGEDEEFIQRVEKYADKNFVPRFMKSYRLSSAGASKLTTMLHGDFWINNFMFREDDQGKPLSMKFLDFQLSCVGHPAVDILFFLYIDTDMAFRKTHLLECLHEYFDNLQVFLKPNIEMEFEDFMQEFNDMRDLAATGALGAMPIVLSPVQIHMRTLSKVRAVTAKSHLEVSSPDKPDDHPNVLEIRRRLLDFVREFDELGLLI